MIRAWERWGVGEEVRWRKILEVRYLVVEEGGEEVVDGDVSNGELGADSEPAGAHD